MKWEEFRTQVPGKWVLAGEHAVLRGATAVALPHHELNLSLSFSPDQLDEGDSKMNLKVKPTESTSLIEELILSVAESWKASGRSFGYPQGTLKVESSIPIGAGLGSSAALCVALSQWMSHPLSIAQSQIAEFATQLEHRFHGRSSGMDVAVISSAEPIAFVMGRGAQSLGIQNLPKFTFHDTGLRSRTSECVLKVEAFRENSPTFGLQVDEAMGAASRMAMEGLILFDSGNRKEGLSLIQKAMQTARECFYSWELVPGEAKRLEESLLSQGALATKLTGAGGGGIVVALWRE